MYIRSKNLETLEKIKFVDCKRTLAKWVANTLTSEGFIFNSYGNEKLEQIFNSLKPQLKGLLYTSAYNNSLNGFTYLVIDRMNNGKLCINIANPANVVRVEKINGVIVSATLNINYVGNDMSVLFQRTYKQNTIENISKDNKYSMKDLGIQNLITHNLGICPVIEIENIKQYNFMENILNNTYNPSAYLKEPEQFTYLETNYQSIYKPDFADIQNFDWLINESYRHFYKLMVMSKPKWVVAGANTSTQKKIQSNTSDFIDESVITTLQSGGIDTKISAQTPTTNLPAFIESIANLVKQMYFWAGFNDSLNEKGNNKTQTEIEEKEKLNSIIFAKKKEAMESGIERMLDIYLHWDSIINNWDYKSMLLNDDYTKFKFEMKVEQDINSDIDNIVKLMSTPLPVITQVEAYSIYKNISMEEAQKHLETYKSEYDKFQDTLKEKEGGNNDKPTK